MSDLRLTGADETLPQPRRVAALLNVYPLALWEVVT